MRNDNSTTPNDDDEMFIAFAVSITFAEQKNGERAERTTNDNTCDRIMSPVCMDAYIVQRLRSHPSALDSTTICSRAKDDGNSISFNQSQVISHVHSISADVGEDKFGFH